MVSFGMKILIISQNNAYIRQMYDILSHLGSSDYVKTENALNLFINAWNNNAPYDLIVSENTPVVKKLRRLERKMTCNTSKYAKMLIIAQKSSYNNILEAFEVGANTLIKPPFSKKDLISI